MFRTELDYANVVKWSLEQKWTPDSASRWQKFFDDVPRMAFAGRANEFEIELLPEFPVYNDLKAEECQKVVLDKSTSTTSKPVTTPRSKGIHQRPYVFLTVISILIASFYQ